MSKPKLFILNGPNMNMLGHRETDIYGFTTEEQMLVMVRDNAERLGFSKVDHFQSNDLGDLVTMVQGIYNARHDPDLHTNGLIINPAGYGDSVALLDALKLLTIPIIEVHVSNIHTREGFRQSPLTARAAKAVICGLGVEGYLLAAYAMERLLIGKK